MAARRADFLVGVPLIKLLSLMGRAKGPAVPSDPHRPPRRLLVIKLAAVGDTVLLIPVLRALREALPNTEIDWLVSSVNEAIARTVPYVNRILLWKGISPGTLVSLVRSLRASRYDAVIDFEQWARGTALLSYFTSAPTRLGFDTPRQHRAGLFTGGIKKDFRRHEVDDFFALARCLWPLRSDRRLELWETDRGRQALERFSSLSKMESGTTFRVLIHPGCGSDGTPREWPLPRYAVLGHWLIKRFGAELVLTGGPEERWKTRQLAALLGGNAIDMGGQLSWEALISLMPRCHLVISGNTGVMHIAAAMHRSQVALHGPTSADLWGPINDHARVVRTSCPQCPSLRLGFEYHRRDPGCMEKIEIEEVKRAVEAVLDGKFTIVNPS